MKNKKGDRAPVRTTQSNIFKDNQNIYSHRKKIKDVGYQESPKEKTIVKVSSRGKPWG